MKTKSIGALFVALIVILIISPKAMNQIYTSMAGRLVLVGVVVFFAMNNTTLGLLCALAIITASNQFGSFVEGMENGTVASPAPTIVPDMGSGINLPSLETTMRSKKSGSLPPPDLGSTDNVVAHQPAMLNQKENFTLFSQF